MIGETPRAGLADQGRAAAFHSRSALVRQEKQAMLKALIDVRTVLEEAGVPYHWKRVFGHRTKAIADYAATTQPDVMVIDASATSDTAIAYISNGTSCSISVATGPGVTMCTAMPSRSTSSAKARANAFMPAFDAE